MKFPNTTWFKSRRCRRGRPADQPTAYADYIKAQDAVFESSFIVLSAAGGERLGEIQVPFWAAVILKATKMRGLKVGIHSAQNIHIHLG